MSTKSSLLILASLSLIASLHAQSSAARILPPLGLLRLKGDAKANEAAALAAGKYSVDDLSASGLTGATKSKRNNVDYLALDAGKEWSRSLRGDGKDVTYVSFQVYASQTTIVDIAGARLGFTSGPSVGSLQLMYDDSASGTLQWRALNYHSATGKYDGKNFAALTTLTVCLNPTDGVWHLFAGSRLLADNLPLIEPKKNDRRFSIRAGSEGAWVTGLVLSDENPLYEDANANGIDDRFEKEKRGVTLPAGAGLPERKFIAEQWKQAQRTKAPPALFVIRPLADDAPRPTAPKS